MPLPDPTSPRTPLHRRSIEIRGWKREDGLFDVEGHLVDAKDVDFKLNSGVRPAGEAIHSMWLRLTVDRTLTIVDAAASTDAMPYVNECDRITPEYRRLIGLAIRPGYHMRVKELLGGVRGCTHLTELAGTLATAAFQTMAGQLTRDPAHKPYPIDRCHALDSAKPLVAKFYPQWYRGADASPPAAENRQALKGNES